MQGQRQLIIRITPPLTPPPRRGERHPHRVPQPSSGPGGGRGELHPAAAAARRAGPGALVVHARQLRRVDPGGAGEHHGGAGRPHAAGALEGPHEVKGGGGGGTEGAVEGACMSHRLGGKSRDFCCLMDELLGGGSTIPVRVTSEGNSSTSGFNPSGCWSLEQL